MLEKLRESIILSIVLIFCPLRTSLTFVNMINELVSIPNNVSKNSMKIQISNIMVTRSMAERLSVSEIQSGYAKMIVPRLDPPPLSRSVLYSEVSLWFLLMITQESKETLLGTQV